MYRLVTHFHFFSLVTCFLYVTLDVNDELFCPVYVCFFSQIWLVVLCIPFSVVLSWGFIAHLLPSVLIDVVMFMLAVTVVTLFRAEANCRPVMSTQRSVELFQEKCGALIVDKLRQNIQKAVERCRLCHVFLDKVIDTRKNSDNLNCVYAHNRFSFKRVQLHHSQHHDNEVYIILRC